jgi:hypothetical protein
VIVTRDGDYLRIAAAGAVHTGIVYGAQERSLGELVRDIVQIWELLEPVEMRGRVEYL